MVSHSVLLQFGGRCGRVHLTGGTALQHPRWFCIDCIPSALLQTNARVYAMLYVIQVLVRLVVTSRTGTSIVTLNSFFLISEFFPPEADLVSELILLCMDSANEDLTRRPASLEASREVNASTY